MAEALAAALGGDGAGPVAPGRLAVDMLGAGAEGCAYVSVATLSAGFLEGGDGGGGGGGDAEEDEVSLLRRLLNLDGRLEVSTSPPSLTTSLGR